MQKLSSLALILVMMLTIGNGQRAFAKNLPNSQKELLKDFPKDLSHFSWHKKNQTEIKSLLGEPLQKETQGLDTFWYYSLAGGVYDLTVTFHEGQLKSISFLVPYGKWVAADFQKLITANEMKKAETSPAKNPTHTSGDEFTVVSVKYGLAVTVNKDKTLSIKRLLLWAPGEQKP